MRTVALAIALAVTLVAGPAEARFGGTRPLLLRLEGNVGPTSTGPRQIAELTLRRGERRLVFHVVEIWVLSGGRVGIDVLHEVEPYTPNMSVEGPRELLDRLEQAPPPLQLEVTGYFRSSQRMLMLSSVEPQKPKKP
jgi:hypothetical protein